MNKIVKKSKGFVSLLLLSVMILSMSIPAVYAQSTPVSDIGSHWAKQEISSWIEQGFIDGYPDGTFKPNNSISRAEFIKLVNSLFAFSEKAPVSFTDVKESDWFYAEFAKASKVGYLSGYKAGTIDPNGLITRQEVATIAAKVKLLQEDAAAANGFADAALIPAESKGFIGAVAKAKVMNGYPDKKFEPLKNITRAESIVALNKLISIITEAVKIEVIKDQTATVNATTTVAIKMITTDAKASIQNSDDKVVQATLNGASIQLKGLKVGTATITVTGKKDGMLDGVITFKVTVSAAVATTSGGGGGGGSHGGGNNGGGDTTPQPDEAAVTVVQPIVGTTTEVTGSYKKGVAKVEVIYGTVTLTPALTNGTFSCSITPGLPIDARITVNGYVGSTVVDTDEVTVVEDDSKLTAVQAIGNLATQVTGKYTGDVTKIEVICGSETFIAEKKNDGTLFQNIYPGLANGTDVTVKAYIGSVLVDTDVVKVGVAIEKTYLSNLKATGTLSTQVTGNYANGVSKVEVITSTETLIALLNEDGTIFQNIYPGLAAGTTITVKAYVGTVLVETKTVVTPGAPPVEGPMITDVKALSGGAFTYVTGNYKTGVTRIDVIYSVSNNTITESAIIKSNGTFTLGILQSLAIGAPITVKSYVGEALKDEVNVNVQ